jgi:hypothetical protein
MAGKRVCRVCGHEYGGLACPKCHPRGSRKKQQAAIDAELLRITTAQSSEQAAPVAPVSE